MVGAPTGPPVPRRRRARRLHHFSAYAVDTRSLLQPSTVGIAFTYLAGTLLAALLAVVAVWATRLYNGG